VVLSDLASSLDRANALWLRLQKDLDSDRRDAALNDLDKELRMD
jgi:hypothetical protein